MNFFAKKQHTKLDYNYYKNTVGVTQREEKKGEVKVSLIISYSSDGRVEPIQTTAKQRSPSVPLLSRAPKSTFGRLEKRVFYWITDHLKSTFVRIGKLTVLNTFEENAESTFVYLENLWKWFVDDSTGGVTVQDTSITSRAGDIKVSNPIHFFYIKI